MSTLKEEVAKTIQWLAEVDLRNNGEISKGTLEVAKMQEVELVIPKYRIGDTVLAMLPFKRNAGPDAAKIKMKIKIQHVDYADTQPPTPFYAGYNDHGKYRYFNETDVIHE